MYTLAIDVGNTHTVFGIINKNGKIESSFRMRSNRLLTLDELEVFLDQFLNRTMLPVKGIQKAILGSVVIELEKTWLRLLRERKQIEKVIEVDCQLPWSFQIAVENPKQIGADRLANIEGALRYGIPLVIIDTGTAITFDVIVEDSDRPVYLGGLILPGMEISMNALIRHTSRLPDISLDTLESRVPVVGNETTSAIRSGLLHGYGGMIDTIVDRICEEQKWTQKPTVIGTGGYIHYFSKYVEKLDLIVPDLTLDGLYAISSK